jgi:hypothetical protein
MERMERNGKTGFVLEMDIYLKTSAFHSRMLHV